MSEPKLNFIRISILSGILIALVVGGMPEIRTRRGYDGVVYAAPASDRPSELSELIQQEDNQGALALIEQGAAVNQPDSFGKTPLIVACAKRKPSYDVIKALIRKGAEVNTEDQHGSTALGFAVDAQDLNMTELLLKAGADVNKARFIRNTALVMAAENSDADWRILKLLVKHGGDVNVRGVDGLTPLMIIAQCCDAQMTKYLLAAGSSVAIRDNFGRTALDHARWRHCTEVINILEAVNRPQ